MKYSNINVEFKKPENEIKEQLSRSGARNIYIIRSCGGEIEVRYTIKCADPEKEIQNFLSTAGAKDVRSSSSYNGARFDYKLDDNECVSKILKDIEITYTDEDIQSWV